MWKWLKRSGPIRYLPSDRAVAPRPVISGKYLSLYTYLHDRYADTVVLTFGQIESLVGFSLPDQARLNQQWWTNDKATAAESNHSDSWILARRVATANLLAQTVAFDRA